MSDKKYDSVLVGYAEEPKYNDQGELMAWKVRFNDDELSEVVKKYATNKTPDGKGGNVYLTLFMSRAGKACCRVYDPNSEAAKEWASKRDSKQETDLPF
tara:strand:+ start:4795 stop:5091 length:297 start_codon:yes stop_codon:yes gene_type:complete